MFACSGLAHVRRRRNGEDSSNYDSTLLGEGEGGVSSRTIFFSLQRHQIDAGIATIGIGQARGTIDQKTTISATLNSSDPLLAQDFRYLDHPIREFRRRHDSFKTRSCAPAIMLNAALGFQMADHFAIWRHDTRRWARMMRERRLHSAISGYQTSDMRVRCPFGAGADVTIIDASGPLAGLRSARRPRVQDRVFDILPPESLYLSGKP